MKTSLLPFLLSTFICLLMLGCSTKPEDLFTQAKDALTQEDWETAVNKLEQLKEKEGFASKLDEVYNLLGVAYWKSGDTNQAIYYLEESLNINGDQFDASYNLGVLQFMQGQTHLGDTLLKRAADNSPSDPLPFIMLGQQWLQRDAPQKASAAFMQAHKRAPHSAEILTSLGIAEAKQQRLSTARSYFNEALRHESDYAPAMKGLGEVYKATGDEQKATLWLGRYDRLTTPAPSSDPSPEKQQTDSTPPPLRVLPQVRNNATPPPKNNSSSVSSTRNTISAEHQEVEQRLKRARAEALSNSCERALMHCLIASAKAKSAGDIALQERALKQATALCGNLPKAHFALGKFYMQNNRPAEATKSFERAVNLKPDWYEARKEYAQAAIDSHAYQNALHILKETVAAFPESADALWNLGVFYRDYLNLQSHAQECFDQYNRRFGAANKESSPDTPSVPTVTDSDTKPKPRHALTRINPIPRKASPKPESTSQNRSHQTKLIAVTPGNQKLSSEAARNFYYGTQAQKEENVEEALRYYNIALTQAPDYAPLLYNLGLLHQKQEQFPEAVHHYRKAIQMSPSLFKAQYNLALALKEMGNTDEAIEELSQLIRKNDQHAPAHYLLGLLYAQRGQPASAKVHYQRFLSLAPQDPASPRIRQWLNAHTP